MTCAFCGSSKAQLRTDLLMVQCVNQSECRRRHKLSNKSDVSWAEFEKIRLAHPKEGRIKTAVAFTAYCTQLQRGATPEEIAAAHANYLRMLARPENSWRQPQNMDTWIRNWQDWKPEPTQAPEPEDTRSPVRRVAEDLVYPWILANGDPRDSEAVRAKFNEDFIREVSWPDGYRDRWARYVYACICDGVPPIPEEVTSAKA